MARAVPNRLLDALGDADTWRTAFALPDVLVLVLLWPFRAACERAERLLTWRAEAYR